MEVTPEIIEWFQNNIWALVFSEALDHPAIIALLTAISLAITLWGVKQVISLSVNFNFGSLEKSYNEGYLEGFKKGIETVRSLTNKEESG